MPACLPCCSPADTSTAGATGLGASLTFGANSPDAFSCCSSSPTRSLELVTSSASDIICPVMACTARCQLEHHVG